MSPPLVQVVPQHIPHSHQYTPGLLGGNEIQRDPSYPRDLMPPPDLLTSPTKSPLKIPPVTFINEGELPLTAKNGGTRSICFMVCDIMLVIHAYPSFW